METAGELSTFLNDFTCDADGDTSSPCPQGNPVDEPQCGPPAMVPDDDSSGAVGFSDEIQYNADGDSGNNSSSWDREGVFNVIDSLTAEPRSDNGTADANEGASGGATDNAGANTTGNATTTSQPSEPDNITDEGDEEVYKQLQEALHKPAPVTTYSSYSTSWYNQPYSYANGNYAYGNSYTYSRDTYQRYNIGIDQTRTRRNSLTNSAEFQQLCDDVADLTKMMTTLQLQTRTIIRLIQNLSQQFGDLRDEIYSRTAGNFDNGAVNDDTDNDANDGDDSDVNDDTANDGNDSDANDDTVNDGAINDGNDDTVNDDTANDGAINDKLTPTAQNHYHQLYHQLTDGYIQE